MTTYEKYRLWDKEETFRTPISGVSSCGIGLLEWPEEAFPIFTTRSDAPKRRDGEYSYDLIAKYWSTYLGIDLSEEDVAFLLTLFKLARYQKTNKLDHAHDLKQYAGEAFFQAEINEACSKVKGEENGGDED